MLATIAGVAWRSGVTWVAVPPVEVRIPADTAFFILATSFPIFHAFLSAVTLADRGKAHLETGTTA